jgi:DNA-directed RNA polymerase subunit K/omega
MSGGAHGIQTKSSEERVRVFTPHEVARHTGSKYLGVLVAAKYTRELNALPRDLKPIGEEKKLTTRSLEALTSGQIEFRLVGRRRRED